jgi:hypothetical protein
MEAERRYYEFSDTLHGNRYRVCTMSGKDDFASAAMKDIAMKRPGNILIYAPTLGYTGRVSVLINCPYYNKDSALRSFHKKLQHDEVALAMERLCYSMTVHSLLERCLPDILPECRVDLCFGDACERINPFLHTECRTMQEIASCDKVANEVFVRAAQRRRQQSMMLAVCMGAHARLGEHSLLRLLPDMFVEIHLVPLLLSEVE